MKPFRFRFQEADCIASVDSLNTLTFNQLLSLAEATANAAANYCDQLHLSPSPRTTRLLSWANSWNHLAHNALHQCIFIQQRTLSENITHLAQSINTLSPSVNHLSRSLDDLESRLATVNAQRSISHALDF